MSTKSLQASPPPTGYVQNLHSPMCSFLSIRFSSVLAHWGAPIAIRWNNRDTPRHASATLGQMELSPSLAPIVFVSIKSLRGSHFVRWSRFLFSWLKLPLGLSQSRWDHVDFGQLIVSVHCKIKGNKSNIKVVKWKVCTIHFTNYNSENDLYMMHLENHKYGVK